MASALAASVLPTPASPSSRSGFSRASERYRAVARPRSGRYAAPRSPASSSSIVANAMSRTISRAGRAGSGSCCLLWAHGDRIGTGFSAFEEERRVTSTSLETAQVVVPTSREEAIEAFGDGSDVTVMGGGTILMNELNYGRLRPDRVLLLEHAPEPLGSAARWVADGEIRAQATLGANLCAGSGTEAPRCDLQGALIALGAS